MNLLRYIPEIWSHPMLVNEFISGPPEQPTSKTLDFLSIIKLTSKNQESLVIGCSILFGM